MINIKLPQNFKEERKYVVNTLMVDFLGLSTSITYGDFVDTEIVLTNGSRIIIKDYFFKKYQSVNDYLKKSNIPKSIQYLSSNNTSFLTDFDLPILYGNNTLDVQESLITCHIDLIASSFFMLTRWEEYVSDIRDKHNRFPAYESLAFKENILQRPIVNEYIDFLWQMLTHLGIESPRKKKSFSAIVTHDVDRPRLFNSNYTFLKKAGGDILKRRSPGEFKFTIKSCWERFILNKKDPWDTFDFLMSLSESKNIQSHFYFMSGGVTTFDNYYTITDTYITKLLLQIKDRGHITGFHPSYNTYNDRELFLKERNQLQNISKQVIEGGRQHYLRFESPTTWRIWDDCNMKWDCSVGYPGSPGFRCGICDSFHPFDFINRKQLKLLEIPLTVMEGDYITYQQVSPKEMFTNTVELINTVKKHNGTFVFLWHNSTFNTPDYQPYEWVYKSIIDHF